MQGGLLSRIDSRLLGLGKGLRGGEAHRRETWRGVQEVWGLLRDGVIENLLVRSSGQLPLNTRGMLWGQEITRVGRGRQVWCQLHSRGLGLGHATIAPVRVSDRAQLNWRLSH